MELFALIAVTIMCSGGTLFCLFTILTGWIDGLFFLFILMLPLDIVIIGGWMEYLK
jgi:hypothetical protein